jgi:hypothetical protein
MVFVRVMSIGSLFLRGLVGLAQRDWFLDVLISF